MSIDPISEIIFAKCKFGGIETGLHHKLEGNGVVTNLTVRQCVLSGISPYYNSPEVQNLYITNSHLNSVGGFSSTSTIHIDHCVVTGNINRSVYATNNILYKSLNSGSTAKSNIFVGLNSSIGGGVQDMDNNWTGIAGAGIWAEDGEDGSYAENKTFELKYPQRYIGTDGTQVGLHGGNYPWNKIPSIPRITESNIDTKTSADGKLKVSIKVEAQTKD